MVIAKVELHKESVAGEAQTETKRILQTGCTNMNHVFVNAAPIRSSISVLAHSSDSLDSNEKITATFKKTRINELEKKNAMTPYRVRTNRCNDMNLTEANE